VVRTEIGPAGSHADTLALRSFPLGFCADFIVAGAKATTILAAE
jgi:hypothetical protein